VTALEDTPAEATAAPEAVLFRKLAEVMGAVHYVPKTGYNSFHKYKYAQEADLVEAVRGELAKRNVAVIPSLTGIDERPCKAGSKDSIVTTARVAFTFVCGDTGAMFRSDWAGQGEDPVDKGLYSAYTGALKYFLTKTFLIATGDDPERDRPAARGSNGQTGTPAPVPVAAPAVTADVPVPTEDVATPEQRRLINAKAAEAKLSARSLNAVIKAVTGSHVADRIPARLVDPIKTTVEAVGRTPEDFGEEPLIAAIAKAHAAHGGKPFGTDVQPLVKQIVDTADVPF
jgi:hypothetical protein